MRANGLIEADAVHARPWEPRPSRDDRRADHGRSILWSVDRLDHETPPGEPIDDDEPGSSERQGTIINEQTSAPGARVDRHEATGSEAAAR